MFLCNYLRKVEKRYWCAHSTINPQSWLLLTVQTQSLNPPPLPFPILQIWSWLSWINKLLKYVKGSYPCPEQYLRDKDDNITLTINPNYETWMEQDSLVSQWINVTLTPQVLQRVVGLQTSHDVWLDLNDFILFIPVLKSFNKTTISNNKKG